MGPGRCTSIPTFVASKTSETVTLLHNRNPSTNSLASCKRQELAVGKIKNNASGFKPKFLVVLIVFILNHSQIAQKVCDAEPTGFWECVSKKTIKGYITHDLGAVLLENQTKRWEEMREVQKVLKSKQENEEEKEEVERLQCKASLLLLRSSMMATVDRRQGNLSVRSVLALPVIV
eukprot:COSAG04_NODE_1893_length_5290_cov_1.894433_2_plen_176_part_00